MNPTSGSKRVMSWITLCDSIHDSRSQKNTKNQPALKKTSLKSQKIPKDPISNFLWPGCQSDCWTSPQASAKDLGVINCQALEVKSEDWKGKNNWTTQLNTMTVDRTLLNASFCPSWVHRLTAGYEDSAKMRSNGSFRVWDSEQLTYWSSKSKKVISLHHRTCLSLQ